MSATVAVSARASCGNGAAYSASEAERRARRAAWRRLVGAVQSPRILISRSSAISSVSGLVVLCAIVGLAVFAIKPEARRHG
jgi:hypothetical protein